MYHTFKNNILKMILKKKKKNTYRLKNNSNHFYFPNLIFMFYMFLSNSIDERGHSIDFSRSHACSAYYNRVEIPIFN